MKKNLAIYIKIIPILCVVIFLVRLLSDLPWWGFIIPVMALGVLLEWKNIRYSTFAAGFLAGFVIWVGASVYFDSTTGGNILYRMGLLLSVPKIVVIFASGIIGGGLTGLALYCGKCMVSFDKANHSTL